MWCVKCMLNVVLLSINVQYIRMAFINIYIGYNKCTGGSGISMPPKGLQIDLLGDNYDQMPRKLCIN